MATLRADKEGTLKARIIDAEGDEVKCSFHYDDCVQLDTSGLTYVTLSKDNLYDLIDLIDRAEAKYDKIAASKK
jgi:hypothetical protein